MVINISHFRAWTVHALSQERSNKPLGPEVKGYIIVVHINVQYKNTKTFGLSDQLLQLIFFFYIYNCMLLYNLCNVLKAMFLSKNSKSKRFKLQFTIP